MSGEKLNTQKAIAVPLYPQQILIILVGSTPGVFVRDMWGGQSGIERVFLRILPFSPVSVFLPVPILMFYSATTSAI